MTRLEDLRVTFRCLHGQHAMHGTSSGPTLWDCPGGGSRPAARQDLIEALVAEGAIDYVAARDALRRMDDLIADGGPGSEGLGEMDAIMACVDAALGLNVNENDLDH